MGKKAVYHALCGGVSPPGRLFARKPRSNLKRSPPASFLAAHFREEKMAPSVPSVAACLHTENNGAGPAPSTPRSAALEAITQGWAPGAPRQREALRREGFMDPLEVWEDGRTTLDRLLGHGLPVEAWVSASLYQRPAELDRKVEALHGLARWLEARAPGHLSWHALHLQSLALSRADTSWRKAVECFEKDMAQAMGWIAADTELTAQAWLSSLAWACAQSPSAVGAMVLNKASASHACRLRNASEHARATAAILDAGAASAGLLEGASDEDLRNLGRRAHWHQTLALVLVDLSPKTMPQSLLQHPGWWPLAMPHNAFLVAPDGAQVLSRALAAGNAWPATATFMRMAESPVFQSRVSGAWAMLQGQWEQRKAEARTSRLEAGLAASSTRGTVLRF